MTALFVNHLTVMDFSYVDAHRGILGESWIVDVVLYGDLDEQGMVFDFGDVKKQLKRAIDDLYDHRLLVPESSPNLTAFREADQLELDWQDTQERKYQHISPNNAVVLLPIEKITPSSVTPLLEHQVKKVLPHNVEKLTLTLRNEPLAGPYYQYSHGLKKHRGNCQRIAHGHRSPIEIYVDQSRSPQLEKEWADKWRDIYIGTREDISEETQREGVNYTRFYYEAEQGTFELTLPTECCYIIDTDSTVEHLASHLADTIKSANPNAHIMVKAYEGVWKGAIATRA